VISPATIQQIQSRIDIIEIISGFVKLKKRGTNYLGLCPFHNEKSPSFTVSPAKEIYKCFGCGKSGNTISFLMEHEKYSYVEALRWLAAKYNVTIEETEVSAEVKQQQQTSDSLFIINSFAQKFFSEALFETEEGKDIGLSYLKERGFREDIIKKFQIGYNPNARDGFAKAALEKQYSLELLQKTGLVTIRDEKPADNYRGRIIFPVHNQTGKVMGFGARLIKSNDKAPKYINTPENEIYVKSKILYGSWFARMAIDKADECLLVEGYTDVVSLHQAGIENVVASGGTSLTPDQLRLIKKYTNNLTIIYDGDAAGVKAALRGLDLALEEGLNVQLVLLPNNEDPDSYVHHHGASGLTEFIKFNKKDFILFQLDLSLKDIGDDSNKKSQVVNQIADTISRMNRVEDFTKQQDYIKKSSQLLGIDEGGLHALVNKFIREKVVKEERKNIGGNDFSSSLDLPVSPAEEGLSLLSRDELNEQALVRCLLEYGNKEWEPGITVAQHIVENIRQEDIIENKDLLQIIDVYMGWYDAGLQPTSKNFLYYDDHKLSTLVVSIIEFAYEVSYDGWKKYELTVPKADDNYKNEVISSLMYLKLRKIKQMITENQKALEKPNVPEEQMILLQLHQRLKEMEINITQQVGTVILK
jgi:DNA primase